MLQYAGTRWTLCPQRYLHSGAEAVGTYWHLVRGAFHTTGRLRRGTPLGALDMFKVPPPLEAWGTVEEDDGLDQRC